jgi:hypothetical protein
VAALVREAGGLHVVAQAELGKDPRYVRLDPVTEGRAVVQSLLFAAAGSVAKKEKPAYAGFSHSGGRI